MATPRPWQVQKRRHQEYIRSWLDDTELIREARDWVEDCGGDTTDRSDWQVLEAVSANYVGGLSAFVCDGEECRLAGDSDEMGAYQELQKVTVCESGEGMTCSSPNGKVVVRKALEEYAAMVDKLRPEVDAPFEEIDIKKIRIASARRAVAGGDQDEPAEFLVSTASASAIESAKSYVAPRRYAAVGA